MTDHRLAADRIMVGLARVLVHAFFRRVSVEHGERMRPDRPIVLVANHRNGLVDGLLLMASLRRYPRFLGKSTLFHIPLLWPFLKVGGVVPVQRAQDVGSTASNTKAFTLSNRVLAKGGMVAIFPEGISHDRPGLQPLRTGAARIALGAAADGVADLETVAVALVYDDKQRFRSRALVRVGMPEPVDRWMERYRTDHRGAVRALTDHLADRLRGVGPDYPSWAEAEQLADIAEIVARAETVLPGEVSLVAREQVVEALAEAAAPSGSAAMDQLRLDHARYSHDLAVLGLDDGQVAASYRSAQVRWAVWGAMAKAVGTAPFAAVGIVIHVVPYLVVKRLSRMPENEGMRATVKLLSCFFSFTAVYLVLGVWIGEAFGALFGILAAAGAPVCGYIAVRMTERLQHVGEALEGFRVAGGRSPVLASVLAHRAAVLDAAERVLASPLDGVGNLESTPPPTSGP